jgi:TPR repeat protein
MRLLVATFLAFSTAPLWAQEAFSFSELDILRARADLLDGRADEALAVLKPAAEAGNARAQMLYGSTWEYGDTGVVDVEEAVRWYEMSAAQGHARAMMILGDLYRYGPSVPAEAISVDFEKAREWYERAIADDYPAAFGQLGDMLMFGEGFPADHETALIYVRRGADAGDVLSSATLGRAYLNGLGVPQDDGEARHHLLLGAAGGNAVAQNDLAYMAINGRGGPQDLVLAQDMLRRAMEQGLDIAGQTMAELILAHPELGDSPLSGEAHCIWATTYATDQWSPADAPWRDECAQMLEGLTPAELKQADRIAQGLAPSE